MSDGMKWQPIETAPRDGTLVLLYAVPTTYAGVFSYGGWQIWEGEIGHDQFETLIGGLNSWVPGYGPTHWMPLPPPPSAEEGQ